MTSNSNHNSPHNSRNTHHSYYVIPQISFISYLRQNIFVDSEHPSTQHEIQNEEEEQNNQNNSQNEQNEEEMVINEEESSEVEMEVQMEESIDERYNDYMNEDYIDFRVYPLNIDWKEVENYNKNYYDIYDTYGYFGIATFSLLSKVKGLALKFNDYIYSVLTYYYISYIKKDYSTIKEIYDNLPPLNKILFILRKGMVSKKEVVIMKIVLDLYEKIIFDNKTDFLFNKKEDVMKTYIQCANIFYIQLLKEEDEMFIYEIISSEMKRTYEILQRMRIKVYSSKDSYIAHISVLYKTYIMLKKGLTKDMFVM